MSFGAFADGTAGNPGTPVPSAGYSLPAGADQTASTGALVVPGVIDLPAGTHSFRVDTWFTGPVQGSGVDARQITLLALPRSDEN